MENKIKFCFVVHRYPPYAGGSEYYVQQMAEECVSRGIDTTVVATHHEGSLNGVKVTSNLRETLDKDLVIVHGGNPGIQFEVLHNSKRINSPVLYLLIEPSESTKYINILDDVDFIGCSSLEDWDHVHRWKVEHKSFNIPHGISHASSVGQRGVFKEKYGIPEGKRMFFSCGGYWPNKMMPELSHAFQEADIPNSILVTTGYDGSFPDQMTYIKDKVISLTIEDPQEIKNALSDSECYIMNSSLEGFGLVILESMINKTPWVGRNIAGARMLSDFGQVYDSYDQLVSILKNFVRDEDQIEKSYQHVLKNNLIKNTVDGIMNVYISSKKLDKNVIPSVQLSE